MAELTVTPTPLIGNWDEQKVKLKAKFPNLRDEDLEYEEGQREEMLKNLQVRLGKSKEELAAIISAL